MMSFHQSRRQPARLNEVTIRRPDLLLDALKVGAERLRTMLPTGFESGDKTVTMICQNAPVWRNLQKLLQSHGWKECKLPIECDEVKFLTISEGILRKSLDQRAQDAYQAYKRSATPNYQNRQGPLWEEYDRLYKARERVSEFSSSLLDAFGLGIRHGIMPGSGNLLTFENYASFARISLLGPFDSTSHLVVRESTGVPQSSSPRTQPLLPAGTTLNASGHTAV